MNEVFKAVFKIELDEVTKEQMKEEGLRYEDVRQNFYEQICEILDDLVKGNHRETAQYIEYI